VLREIKGTRGRLPPSMPFQQWVCTCSNEYSSTSGWFPSSDLVVPCFEEVSYLAMHVAELGERERYFFPSLEVLTRLHDKRRFVRHSDLVEAQFFDIDYDGGAIA
jgi:hypothetical protein